MNHDSTSLENKKIAVPVSNMSLEEEEKIAVPTSNSNKVPRFLIWTYILLPIWGILWFYFFWNGSVGWFDRGFWRDLQDSAGTTYIQANSNVKSGQPETTK